MNHLTNVSHSRNQQTVSVVEGPVQMYRINSAGQSITESMVVDRNGLSLVHAVTAEALKIRASASTPDVLLKVKQLVLEPLLIADRLGVPLNVTAETLGTMLDTAIEKVVNMSDKEIVL